MDQIRADTPAASRLAYLHNAGAALMPTPVVAAMKSHIDLESEIGGYAAADRESDRLDSVYGSVARLLNAAPDEIALTENATVAWQMAFYALSFRAGDRILTAEAEYAANYVAFLQVAKRTGAIVEIVPSDVSGELDIHALERMIDERVKLIAITWVPTNGGLINPAAAVGKIARAHGIPYLLDACRAVGQMEVDIEAVGCDMLSATGRKFLRGPRGTGFLYVRQPLLQRLEPPMIDHFAAPWVSREHYQLRDDARQVRNLGEQLRGASRARSCRRLCPRDRSRPDRAALPPAGGPSPERPRLGSRRHHSRSRPCAWRDRQLHDGQLRGRRNCQHRRCGRHHDRRLASVEHPH